MRKLPRLNIRWVKLQAHLDRYPRDINELLSIVMDELANTVNFDDMW